MARSGEDATILVTGATGKVGREVVHLLLEDFIRDAPKRAVFAVHPISEQEASWCA